MLVRDNQRCRYYPDCEIHESATDKRRKEIDAMVPVMEEMLKNGSSYVAVAKALKVAESSVIRRLPNASTQSKRNKEIEALVPTMLKMLEDGCSYNEIGRTLGIGEHAVRSRFPGMSQWMDRSENSKFALAVRWSGKKVSAITKASGSKRWRPLKP